MLRNGEELVWAMALGQDNASEQPFTAYEFLIGPPAFITTTLDHWDGSNDLVPHKTWLLWTRGLPSVMPGAPVPPHPGSSSAVGP